MNSQAVISLYATVAAITDQMLAAARNGDWEQFVALESRCASHVETLKAGEPSIPLTGAARESKRKLIRKILAEDRKIRAITEPWMANLSRLINAAGTERKLTQAYAAAPRYRGV